MLYSIIPPILIIVSLVSIILFLMKKSSKVANISIEEIIREEEERRITMEDAGFFQKINLKIKGLKWDDVKHYLLAILENITRKSRVIFLKLESKFGNWSSDIRAKRKARAEKKIALESHLEEKNIIQKLQEYKLEKSSRPKYVPEEKAKEAEIIISETFISSSMIEDEAGSSEKNMPVTEEEKIIKPIISEKIVKPRKHEIRDRLEELLVERIAVNPKDIEAYERLGQYYMEIKSHEDAKECFKQVIKLDPGNRNAKYKLKRLESLLAQ